MKTIYLARHAKSSWRNDHLDDIDRPLKSSGVVTANHMAFKLNEMGVNVDAVYTSPAIRALHTALIFSRAIRYPLSHLKINGNLYESSKESIFSVIREVPGAYESILIFGHDPSFTNTANHFLSSPLEKIKTAHVVKLVLSTDSWETVSEAKLNSATYILKETNQDLT